MAAISGGCGCASAPPPPLLALKYNNKPYQLTMMKFHHHHHHRGGGLVSQSERAKLKLKPIMASSSSSSSSSSSPMSNQAKQALQNRSAVSALWARLHPTSIVFFVVVLRDEDDLIKKKFDRIVFKFQRFRNYRGSLVESIDCLLNNADSIISSSTVVCCSYLQSAGNVAKLDKFMQRRFHGQRVAEDDISCTWVVLYMTTSDEISDENIHTVQDFKAFLQKLRLVKGPSLLSAYPCSSKVYLDAKLDSSYKHLSVPIRTNVVANLLDVWKQLTWELRNGISDFFQKSLK